MFICLPTVADYNHLSLLLINDGQDLPVMPFTHILDNLYASNSIDPIFCVGIHCGTDRKNEYGTAGKLHYKGLGAKAAPYTQFVMQELLPFITKTYDITSV